MFVSTIKDKNKQHSNMLVFDGLIIIAFGFSIYLLIQGEQQDNVDTMALGIDIIEIVHPVTYINKIIAYSSDRILLVNPIAQKLLFDYASFTK